MEHKSSAKSQSPVVATSVVRKLIPTKNILHLPQTNPRQELREDRVQEFLKMYEDKGHSVAPIEVLAIQTGDPKNVKYVVLEGLHRSEAQHRLKLTEFDANVHCDPCITLADLDEEKVIIDIFDLSCPYNSDTRLPLTTEEKRAAAEKLLFKGNRSEEAIAKSLKIGLRYLEELLAPAKQRVKEEQKGQVFTLLDQGHSQVKVSEMTEIPRKTINDWDKERKAALKGGGGNPDDREIATPPSTEAKGTAKKGGGNGGNGKVTGPGKDPGGKSIITDKDTGPLAGVNTKIEPLPADADPAVVAEKIEESLSSIRKIHEVIRAMHWGDEVDARFLDMILPLLSEKSPAMQTVLHIDQGFKSLYQTLKSEYDQLREKHIETNIASVAKDKEIADLKAKLASREEFCKLDCEFVRANHQRVLERSSGILLSTLQTLSAAITEGHILDRGAKSMNFPDGKPIEFPHGSEAGLTQLALNLLYLELSHFENAMIHGLHKYPKAVEQLEALLDITRKLHLDKKKDVNERLREIKTSYPELSNASERR